MITENIMLRSDLKKGLKHLSIDKDKYVSSMLISGAYDLMDKNRTVQSSKYYNDFDSFTMKIDKELKDLIKTFCSEKDVKIKDFWNEVAIIVLENDGEFDEEENIPIF